MGMTKRQLKQYVDVGWLVYSEALYALIDMADQVLIEGQFVVPEMMSFAGVVFEHSF